MGEERSSEHADLVELLTNSEEKAWESENGTDIIERLKELPILLTPSTPERSPEEVEALAPGKKICYCDSYITGCENGEKSGDVFRCGNVLIIDHHMPTEEMSRKVSSTNIAIGYVEEYRAVPRDTVVVINHTDCDSILSSAIMRGILRPLEVFGQAAIAADHTGEANLIADLLQALEEKRNIEFSLRNLQLFLWGKSIESEAQILLQTRLADRERAKKIAEEELRFSPSGDIAYARLDKKIDSGLLPALLPSAKVIILCSPMRDKETKQEIQGVSEIKVRLGLAAPDGTNLQKIMRDIDPKWGGRWNAGSTGRHGGTSVGLDIYVSKIEERLV